MFEYAFFIRLWLVATPGLAFEWLTAPEMFNNTIARLFYEEREYKSHHILSLKVETLLYTANFPDKRCTFDLVSRPTATAMNITSFRQPNKNLIVLSWYDEMANDYYHQTKITILNMNNCTRIDLNALIENAIIVPSYDSLDIFFRDSRYPCVFIKDKNDTCSIYQCWYSYPLENISSTPTTSLTMGFLADLDWSSIRIERLPSKDFIVRGFDGGLYRVLRQNRFSGKLKELMLLRSPHQNLQMASTGLTFCWIYNSGSDNKMYCNQFNDKNELVYSTEASFDEPMIIMYLQSDYEGQISCVVAKAKCTDIRDCWIHIRRNFYRGSNKSSEHKGIINCKSRNRNHKVIFGFPKNTTEINGTIICTRSGDVLGTE
ncbi:uncharacterized protein LOC131666727 [Phymastichus coffea]|uniref:uncharacterized protein LOC131666727 n=1 Tax=Phymastichus coffea TaxID=108790 RepID=UPI00273CAA65|nr:uncharacterized protein LOC131666727 [Phymastichus coffea]